MSTEKRNVGTITIDIIDEGDHFRAELAGTDYAKCGLREFSGPGHVGGFDHIYAYGNTAKDAVSVIAKDLAGFGLTGKIRLDVSSVSSR